MLFDCASQTANAPPFEEVISYGSLGSEKSHLSTPLARYLFVDSVMCCCINQIIILEARGGQESWREQEQLLEIQLLKPPLSFSELAALTPEVHKEGHMTTGHSVET